MEKSLYYKQENKGHLVYRINPVIGEYLDRYFTLDFYGTKVAAPYFINTKRRKDLRALVGKGTPDEMVLETKVWAQVKSVGLRRTKPESIRDLMLKVGIGIDCSGMLYHAFNAYTKKFFGKSFVKFIKPESFTLRKRMARFFRPAENVGALEIGSDKNSQKIAVNEVRPGDIIFGIGKQRNAYHVAVVTEVMTHIDKHNEKETVKEIYYIHSHRGYGDENGVRKGEVKIINPDGSHLDQEWIDNGSDGKNYLLESDLKPFPNETGFRRLLSLN